MALREVQGGAGLTAGGFVAPSESLDEKPSFVWARGEVPKCGTANARDPQRRPQPPPHAADTETDATRASNQRRMLTFGPLHDCIFGIMLVEPRANGSSRCTE